MSESTAPMFPVARARNRIGPDGVPVVDPLTSFESARSLTSQRVSELQTLIVGVLQHRGPGTDEEIADRVRAANSTRRDSDASIRSRRAELVTHGLVEAVPGRYGRTKMGRRCTVWRATALAVEGARS